MRAYRDGDGSDWDWAGALMVTEMMDNLHYLRTFAEGYAKGLKKQARQPRRRR